MFPLTGIEPLTATAEVRRLVEAAQRLQEKIDARWPDESDLPEPAWELRQTLTDVLKELERSLRTECRPFDAMLVEARA